MSSPLASMDEVPESLPEGQSSLTPIDFSSDPEDSDESLSDGADVEDEVPESLPDRPRAPRSPIVIYMPSDEEPWSCDEPDWHEGDPDPPSPQSQNEEQPPRGRNRAASSSLSARPPPVSRSTMAPDRPRSPIVIYMPSDEEPWSCDELDDDTPINLSPIWQSLPVELVQRVLHELVSIHLRDIGSDPFYPWETLRQLNHHQRRRIDALYRELLLPILRLARWVKFYPTTNRPNITGIENGEFLRLWAWDEGEAYDSTNDTITLPLADWEESYEYTLEAPMGGEHGYDHPSFDISKGWNKYVNSFPPGGLYVKPEPHYSLTLEWTSDLSSWMEVEIPASHVPDVQDDDSDDDSIRVSSSQLIGGLIRAWKKSHTSGGTGNRSWWDLLAWEEHCRGLLYGHPQTVVEGGEDSEGEDSEWE